MRRGLLWRYWYIFTPVVNVRFGTVYRLDVVFLTGIVELYYTCHGSMVGHGNCWLVGYNETDTTNRGLYVVQDDTQSGALPSDEEGNVVTIALETISGYKDLPFDATQKAAIIGDTATYITYA